MATRELEISRQEISLGNQRSQDVAACYVIGIAFLLRLVVAASTFLDPDEAFHYLLGNQHSLVLAYQASLRSAHPPLLIFLIYALRGLGNSELVLRLPSVLAGTLSCWFAYKWLTSIADRTTALTALVWLSLSPPLFAVESELRQYSLLLLFATAALYFFEKAIQNNSVIEMLLFSVALWLALAAHYGALLFALTMGVYALLQFFTTKANAVLLATWGFGQLIFLAQAIFFYKTHVPVVEQGISDSWLHKSFYHPGDDTVLFVLTNTYRFFHFIFGQPVIGAVMLVLFVAGLVALVGLRRPNPPQFRKAGWVVLFALALSWTLARADLYPFGGTRHSIFLLPFVVLAIASGLLTVLRNHSTSAPVIAAVAVALSSVFPVPAGPHITPPNQNIVLMRRAVQYVRRQAAPNELVLVDEQSVFPFRYYFCGKDVFPFLQNPQNFTCAGYRVHKSELAWDLSGDRLEADFRDTRAAFGASAVAGVFPFQTGWSVGEQNLRSKLGDAGCTVAVFGKNVLTCEVK